MVSIRDANVEDLLAMTSTNVLCLPENYNPRYWLYHLVGWPHISKIAEDRFGRCVGYVLAKIDDETNDEKIHGHITSLAVARTYRKQGLAGRLMRASMRSMREVYTALYCSLHVRESNRAARTLYERSLKFERHKLEVGYYGDGEDGWEMHCKLRDEDFGLDLTFEDLSGPPGTAPIVAKRVTTGASKSSEEGAASRSADPAESGEGAEAADGGGVNPDLEPGAKDVAEAKSMKADASAEAASGSGDAGAT